MSSLIKILTQIQAEILLSAAKVGDVRQVIASINNGSPIEYCDRVSYPLL